MSRPSTSGVGTIAIQPTKHLGASLATTASATKADLVNNLGADVVIDTVRGEIPRPVIAGAEADGTVISITGPPDPGFTREVSATPVVRLTVAALSHRIRRGARRLRADP